MTFTTALVALTIGLAFGMLLQRVQASSPDRIYDTLALRDLTILKFMVLAIGVGAAGIGALTALGLAHLKIKALAVVAVALGGLVFGVGFAVGGYCPGTCLAGAMEGRRDAWFTIGGGLAGALVYALLDPALRGSLIAPFDYGPVTLTSITGLGPGLLGVGFGALMIVLAFKLPTRTGRGEPFSGGGASPSGAEPPREPGADGDRNGGRLLKALAGVGTVGELPALLPGLALALGVALVGQQLAHALGAMVLRAQGLDPAGKGSPVSAISVAVVLGLVVANTVGVKRLFAPGLDFAMKKMLRLGIVLIGLKLSIVDVLKVGAVGVPVVVGLVLLALVVTLFIAQRTGLSPTLGSLAAASTAICGITATLAIAPAIKADDREVAYTVANVTLFGLMAMLVYPYLAHWLFAASPGAAGLFLGTAIHDTSQVMGAALSYQELFADERAMQVATVAKLTRNAMLIAVVPLLAWLAARREGGAAGTSRQSLRALFPVFVLGFLALSLVRSVGDVGLGSGGLALGLFDLASWRAFAGFFGETIAVIALGTALAGVGLSTRLSVFKGLGFKPLLVGLMAALLVGGASLGLAAVVGPLLG